MIDATGGQYIYFQKMYGNFVSYLYGWSVFAVIQTGAGAAIAYVFGEYLGYFIKYPQLSESWSTFSLYIPIVGNIFPFAEFGAKAVAILCILFLTAINYAGVIFGGCLLYTSDAADERSSVDLGGRRIIKKKNNLYLICDTVI